MQDVFNDFSIPFTQHDLAVTEPCRIFFTLFREQRDAFNVTVLKYMISGKTSFL